MAFVYRGYSRNKFLDLNPISLGPGEYDPEASKIEGKLIHQNNMKFSKVITNHKNPQIIPFNTTSQRSTLVKFDNYTPGPGSYILSQRQKIINNNYSQSTEKEIADIMPSNSPSPNIKGFLSSEKRFTSTNYKEVNNEKIPGPGSYDLISYYT